MITAFFLGFTIAAVFEISRRGAQGFGVPPSSTGSNPNPPFSERVLFAAYFACFVGAPFIGAWIAASASPPPYWGLAMLIAVGLWLILGLTPMLVCAMRGRAHLEFLKAKLQHYGGASFGSLVGIWLFAIGAALFSAARQFYFS